MLLALILTFLIGFPVAYQMDKAPGYHEKPLEPLVIPMLLDIPADTPDAAHAYGKYQNLLAIVEAPDDINAYGKFYDYGFYPATNYAGVEDIPAGFWVYATPNWYIWQETVE